MGMLLGCLGSTNSGKRQLKKNFSNLGNILVYQKLSSRSIVSYLIPIFVQYAIIPNYLPVTCNWP